MNRSEEYMNLLEELNQMPKELDSSLQRASVKYKRNRRRRIMIPFTLVTAFALMFIIMVNGSSSFAYACGRIPVLDKLAKAVSFSPSLKAAVENEYVQPIELEQTIDDITIRIEYVIVDQKQLNVFYSVNSDDYIGPDGMPEFMNMDGSGVKAVISQGSADEETGLSLVTVDFTDEDVPDTIFVDFKVKNTGPFHFEMKLDPYYTTQGEEIIVDKTFEIDTEILTLETAEIYPSHLRFNFMDEKNSTAWMKSLSFYLVNEKGERFDQVINGISATGSVDSKMMRTQRLESSFFSKSKELTLYITGVTWLDKDSEKLKLDLVNVTAEKLPEGVTFHKAVRQNDGWYLTFKAIKADIMSFNQIWDHIYYDEIGKSYEINQWSTGTNEETNEYTVSIPLLGYPYDSVYLEPIFTRAVELTEPIIIKIK